MNFNRLLDEFKDKSGTVCAIAAVAGVFVTAYFSGKAALEAKEKIKPEMETKEKAKEYAKVYAKAAISAAVTSGLILGSDRIHVGKEAALIGVATMCKEKFVDLDNKVIEKLGPEEATKIHKEVLDDEIKRHPYTGKQPDVSKREILVYEPYTDQYIVTTTEKIAWTMLKANEKLQKEYDVRLNYIITMLGGEAKPEGHLRGWNMENDVQEYAWSYYKGPWIDLWPEIREAGNGALTLFYQVDPEPQLPEDMIYNER